MIVITGPGRTGTSVLAAIYKDLGFDPGGSWSNTVNAGLEDSEIVEANELIIARLGMTHLGVPTGTPARIRTMARALLPRAARERLKRRLGRRLPLLASGRPSLLAWQRFPQVASDLGPQLRDIASRHAVVKDPRFCWTIGVWAAAGARVDHVVLTLRDLDSMVGSRARAEHLRYRTDAAAKNGFVYAVGLCVTSLHTYRIPYVTLQFPDFLSSPDDLYANLRFPRTVSKEEFGVAFEATVRPELVHEMETRGTAAQS